MDISTYSNREKVHESYSEKNGLHSIVQVYKYRNLMRNSFVRIPKWKALLTSLLLLLLFVILFAAIIIVATAPAAAGSWPIAG